MPSRDTKKWGRLKKDGYRSIYVQLLAPGTKGEQIDQKLINLWRNCIVKGTMSPISKVLTTFLKKNPSPISKVVKENSVSSIKDSTEVHENKWKEILPLKKGGRPNQRTFPHVQCRSTWHGHPLRSSNSVELLKILPAPLYGGRFRDSCLSLPTMP